LESSVSLHRKRERGHISGRLTAEWLEDCRWTSYNNSALGKAMVATCPNQIDGVRLPLRYRKAHGRRRRCKAVACASPYDFSRIDFRRDYLPPPHALHGLLVKDSQHAPAQRVDAVTKLATASRQGYASYRAPRAPGCGSATRTHSRRSWGW